MENAKTAKKGSVQLMYFIACMLWFVNYVYVPILSPYAEGLGASYTMLGLIISSYGFMQLICRIPIGIFSDALNRRKLFIVFGLACSFVSCVGLFMATTPVQVLIFRGLSGLAVSTWAVYVTMYTGYFPAEEGPKAIGVVSSSMNVGQVAATFLGGLVAMYISERWAFGISALSALFGLVLCLWLPEPAIPRRKPPRVRDYLALLKDYHLVFFSVMAIFLQVSLYTGPLGFVPNIMRDLGANNFIIGLGTTLHSLPAILSSYYAGTWIKKRFGTRRSIVYAFLLMALAMVVMGFVRNIWALIFLQMLTGLSKGLLIPALTSMAIFNIPPQTRSSATAFFQAVYGIGMTIGPILAGWLSDLFNLSVSFCVAAGIAVVGGVLVASNRKARF